MRDARELSGLARRSCSSAKLSRGAAENELELTR